MIETIIAVISAVALLISSIVGIYVARTTAKTKKIEDEKTKVETDALKVQADEIYIHVNQRVQAQYELLLKQKDRRIENNELRISALETQSQIYRKENQVQLEYIGYLLDGIRRDKSATFRPIGLDAFKMNREAAQG